VEGRAPEFAESAKLAGDWHRGMCDAMLGSNNCVCAALMQPGTLVLLLRLAERLSVLGSWFYWRPHNIIILEVTNLHDINVQRLKVRQQLFIEELMNADVFAESLSSARLDHEITRQLVCRCCSL
jgi:hypothetical protein